MDSEDKVLEKYLREKDGSGAMEGKIISLSYAYPLKRLNILQKLKKYLNPRVAYSR
jgi:hypothetical protein